MSESSRGSAWRDFLLELLVVVLGVLAALALSQWWQGREDAGLVRRARSEFDSEIRENREDLLDSAAYHASIPARLDSLLASVAPEDLVESGPLPRGLNFPTLESAAWESAIATGVLRLMAPEDVSVLSAVYSRQEDLTGLREMIMRSFADPAVFEPEKVAGSARYLQIMMNDLAENERGLV